MSIQRTEERIELTAIDRASGVVNQVKGSFDGLRTGVDMAKNALLAMGVTLGAAEMLAYARGVISATAALSNLSAATGATVEGLSQIRSIAQIGGHDFQGFTDAIGTMVRGLKTSGEEGKAASQALEFLGVKARNANGSMRDSVDVLFDVAKALAKYTDDGDKAAIVQDILGKAAAKYIPQLKDMAEQGRGVAKETTRQAEEADKLEKNINRLSASMTEAKRAMVNDLVPALNEVVERLIAANREGGKFGIVVQAWREAAKTGMLGVGGFIAERGLSSVEGLNRNRGGRNLWEYAGLGAGGPGYRVPYADMGYEPELPRPMGSRPSGTKPAGGGDDPYKSLLQGLENELAKTEGVTRAQEVLLQLQQKRYEKVTQGERDVVLAMAKSIDAMKQEEEARKRAAELAAEWGRQMDQELEQREEWRRSSFEQVKQSQFEVELVGKSAGEVEKLTRIRELENSARKAGIDLHGVEFAQRRDAIVQAIDEKNARAAVVKATEEAAKAEEEELKSRREMLTRGITDALMRGFEGGKQPARAFFDSLKNMAKATILEPVVRFLVSPISNAAAGMFPGGAGGGGFGMPGGFNPFSNLSNLFGGGAGSAGAFGGVGAGAMELAGLEAGAAGFFGAGAMSAGMATTGAGAAASAAAAAAGMGGAAAGMSMMGPVGLAAAAALMLMGGEGGGPKGSRAWLQGGRGHFNIGVNDVQGGENMAAINALNALLNDPKKYDPATLERFIGTSVGGDSPADTAALLGQITQALGEAAVKAKELADAERQAAEDAKRIAAERHGLELRMLDAQGNGTAALAMRRQDEIDATDETNRAILRQIHAAEDLAAAAQEAAAAIEREAQAIREEHELRMSIESEGAGIRARLLEITNPGKAAIAAREREIAGTFEENRPLLRELFAVMDAAEEAAIAQKEAGEKSEAAAKALADATDQLERREASLSDAARGLPGRLGIDRLRTYQDAANMSEYLSPMDRLSGARGVYQDLLSRAQGGDLDAVSGLPGAAQSYLGIGRDVYASGGQFQSLFVGVNRSIADVLARQESVQQDLLRGVSVAILQSGANTNDALRTEFEGLKDQIELLRADVRRLKAA